MEKSQGVAQFSNLKENMEINLFHKGTRLLCPLCTLDLSIKPNEIKEFTEYKCKNCISSFKIIKCLFSEPCEHYIYIKPDIKRKTFDYMNIECPFEKCKKEFFLSFCPNCGKLNKRKIEEKMKFIKCDNEKCSYKFMKVRCPFQGCQNFHRIENEVIEEKKSFPNGIKFKHDSKSVRCLSCFYCNKDIYYIDKAYFEGQKIICPHCNKKYHRLICPKCKIQNILDKYEYGDSVICLNTYNNIKCKNIYNKIICVYCRNNNVIVKQNPIGGYTVKCRTQSCGLVSLYINCSNCGRPNVTFGKNYYLGQKIKCAYPDCNKYINKVICPGCKEFNYLNTVCPLTTRIQCNLRGCNTSFLAHFCPKCNFHKLYKNKKCPIGSQFKCECGNIFLNINCPFCKVNIIENDTKIKELELMQCPSCKKNFAFTYCPTCKNPVYGNENQLIENIPIQCQEDNTTFVNVTCQNNQCGCTISYVNKNRPFDPGEQAKCSSCNTVFIPTMNQNNQIEVYTGNLQIFPDLQLGACLFGKEIKSENEEFLYYEIEAKLKYYNYKYNETTTNKITKEDDMNEVDMDANDKNININNKNDNMNPRIPQNQIINNQNNIYNSSKFIGDESTLDKTNKSASNFFYSIVNKIKEKEKLKKDEPDLCRMCNKELRNGTLVPCGHSLLCYKCSERIKITIGKCPISKCNKKIELVLKKIY